MAQAQARRDRRPALFSAAIRLFTTLAALASPVAACSTASDADGPPGGANDGPPPLVFGDASTDAVPPCVNLECRKVVCKDGGTTTITGVVSSPAKTNPDPLYNALVYVPNARVEAFKPGASCDRCNTPASGAPIATALSSFDGSFTLKDVPAGANIPLVVQIGRWRRQVVIPNVSPCVENKLPAELARLPRNHSEGDIPLMAISTGAADALECVLRKIGIDDSEFTPPTGAGRVHVYAGNGATTAPAAPPARELWSDVNVLKRYDAVLLACDGDGETKPDPAKRNVLDYANSGGRVFATHVAGNEFLAEGPDPFPRTATWKKNQAFPGCTTCSVKGIVDTSFPKGQAFADWLSRVGASPTRGELRIEDSKREVDEVKLETQRWIHTTAPAVSVQHLTFNTPVGKPVAEQCGKVLFSAFHVASEAVDTRTNVLPGRCKTGKLNAQEQALEFMLFDLSSCIQKENTAPTLPPVR